MPKKLLNYDTEMLHLNGNLLCVIDTETTGLDYEKHDIIQICILPLNSKLEPHRGILPFFINMKPRFPENIDPEALKVNKIIMDHILSSGLDYYQAAELFEQWFLKLNLAFRKKICPLGQNWPFDRAFIREWLGPLSFEDYFHPWYRDTLATSLFCNDRASFNGEDVPYPKSNLTYLASQLKIKSERAHTALADCVTTAKVYRKMLNHEIFYKQEWLLEMENLKQPTESYMDCFRRIIKEYKTAKGIYEFNVEDSLEFVDDLNNQQVSEQLSDQKLEQLIEDHQTL